MRKIEICIGDICFKATLLDEEAPVTCNALWDILPHVNEAHHDDLDGAVFYFSFYHQINPREIENYYLLNELKPGDISGIGYGIIIVYGQPAPKPSPENLIARVTEKEDLDKLKKAGYRLWFKPGAKVTVRRVEES